MGNERTPFDPQHSVLVTGNVPLDPALWAGSRGTIRKDNCFPCLEQIPAHTHIQKKTYPHERGNEEGPAVTEKGERDPYDRHHP